MEIRSGEPPPKEWDDEVGSEATVFQVIYALWHAGFLVALMEQIVSTFRQQKMSCSACVSCACHLIRKHLTFKSLVMIALAVHSFARLIWAVDPLGFKGTWSLVTRISLAEVALDALSMSVVLFTASWRRLHVSNLKRIKSPVLVGKYKYWIFASMFLLVVVSSLAVWAAAVDSDLLVFISRTLFGLFALVTGMAGLRFGLQFASDLKSKTIVMVRPSSSSPTGSKHPAPASLGRFGRARYKVLRTLVIWGVLAAVWVTHYVVGLALGKLGPEEFFWLYIGSRVTEAAVALSLFWGVRGPSKFASMCLGPCITSPDRDAGVITTAISLPSGPVSPHTSASPTASSHNPMVSEKRIGEFYKGSPPLVRSESQKAVDAEPLDLRNTPPAVPVVRGQPKPQPADSAAAPSDPSGTPSSAML